MSYTDEFQTIKLLKESDAETRGVDAFVLAQIKQERQLRKLFTYLVFQYPCFDGTCIKELRDALAKRRKIYFDGFVAGFDVIAPISIAQLLGADYARLYKSLGEATAIRNKIFHGQLTDQYLTRQHLFDYVDQISSWCELLAGNASAELGYDGFGRNSYQKSKTPKLLERFRFSMNNISDYNKLLDGVMSRR